MITIRPMQVADFAAVYQLGLRCFDVLDKPYNWWSILEVADHLENHGDCCFVAEAVDGQIAGFTLGTEDFELIKDTAHLEWIAVDAAFRGQGIASRLIETAVAHYKGLGREYVVADVSSENAASRKLFEAQGFEEGISVTFFRKKL